MFCAIKRPKTEGKGVEIKGCFFYLPLPHKKVTANKRTPKTRVFKNTIYDSWKINIVIVFYYNACIAR